MEFDHDSAEDFTVEMTDDFDLDAFLEENPNDFTPFIKAVKMGELSRVASEYAKLELIYAPDEKACARNFSQDIAIAIESGHLHVMRFLASMGLPVNAEAVEAAISAGSQEALGFLISHGWDINKPLRNGGSTALGYAVRDKEMVTWLLDHGADPNALGFGGMDLTPLSCAVGIADRSIVELLLSRGGDLNRGQLFHHAADRVSVDEALLELLDHGKAPFDDIQYESHARSRYLRQDFSRGTPLHHACASGNTTAVRFLLTKGADTERLTTRGNKPIELARDEEIRAMINGR